MREFEEMGHNVLRKIAKMKWEGECHHGAVPALIDFVHK
jgi:hypothetical protein